MESNLSIFCKVIHSKYKQSKLSKRDIATKTGLSLNTINNSLSGKNSTMNTMFSLMECLGMNLEDVVAEAKKMNLSFPKSTAANTNTSTTASSANVINDDQVKTMLDSGLNISEVAKKLGVAETEIVQNLQAQMKVPSKKEVKVFQVSE